MFVRALEQGYELRGSQILQGEAVDLLPELHLSRAVVAEDHQLVDVDGHHQDVAIGLAEEDARIVLRRGRSLSRGQNFFKYLK